MSVSNRKSPRLQGYDYSADNYYFVTICTKNKNCIFGDPKNLNTYGKIADNHIKQLSNHYRNVKIDKYVVMPNHIHLIVVLGCNMVNEKNETSLDRIIGLLKSGITKEIHAIDPFMEVWQRSFHDHIIRNQDGYEKIWQYIESNPQNWSKDCFYENNVGKNFNFSDKGNM